MKQSYSTKQRLLASFMALVMCFSMFAGTTLAWFTDTATVGVQNVVTGTLDVDIVDENDETLTERALNFKKAEGHEDEELLWEPGVTYELEDFYILNKGNLALKYKLYISGAVGDSTLLDALEFTVKIDGLETSLETFEGHLTARGTATDKSGLVKVSVHMDETAGNLYQGLKLEGIAITVSATQDTVEFDSYGNNYDENAIYSVINYPVNVKYDIPAEKVGPDNQLIEEILIPAANGIYAKLPVGTQLEDGADKLHFTITYLDPESNNITVGDGEVEIPVDVHIGGVSDDNTQPIEIGMGNMMSKGLNMGNYSMKHVENDVPVDMTENDSLNAHNNFTYNPATGDVTIAIATFSEVTAVADTHAQWKGGFDYSWYTNAVAPIAEGEPDYIIANADQLAGFSAIVGGMNGQAQDSFKDKTVKLISDIDLGDGEETNVEDKIFYPIGYYNDEGTYTKSNKVINSDVNSFEGTFDGNGHTISNFYQNTWEMKGDDSYYDKTLQYYNDAMGLFGYVLNGTVKNLTVNNFKSDGEFTPTGVIAAYAVNSTFENIAITNCNPRVYNTGNGGIIGIAGNTGDQGTQITLKNITVDKTNKISALWGSWDVACGGLVGMFRGNADGGTGKIYFEDCHVAAQIDVYNDVCANYQYYAYRYAGMIIGSVRHNEVKDGKTIPNMTGISASGCTVNYGDWNDYWYCEFVDNSLASYTHDHQFSRVPRTEIDISNGKDKATCIGHNHERRGYETTDIDGDGIIDGHVLKEDKQAVYLPFHQLFTGYSWGVTSVGLEKFGGIYIEGVIESDQNEPEVKFEIADAVKGKKLRVGNGNAFPVGKLFRAIDGKKIDKDGVFVTATSMVDGVEITSTFTLNKTDWKNSTLKINGTGPAKITIQDYQYCIPTEIEVEVINADNAATGALSATRKDVVLLDNLSFSTLTVSGGHTLHGNGFTLSSPNDITGDSMSSAYITLDNGTLDNVQVICPDFSLQIMYDSQAKVSGNVDPNAEWRFKNFRSAVTMNGNSKISNSCISGGRAAVYVRSGSALLDNTTIKGGAIANIHVSAAQLLTLRDMTLVQRPTKATVNDTSKTLMGFSVVFVCDENGSSTPLVLEGTLDQFAWANESYMSYVPTGADSIVDKVLEKAEYKHNFSLNGGPAADWLNLGFAYMPAEVGKSVNEPKITDIRADVKEKPYGCVDLFALGTTTYVYSYKSTNETDDYLKQEPDYTSPESGAVLLPTLSYEDIKEGVTFATVFDALKGWTSTVTVDLDTVDSYSFSFDNLIAGKNGQSLYYSVKADDGTHIDKKRTIELKGSGVTNYILCVSDGDGETTHEMPFTIVAKMAKINPPEKVAEPGGTPLLVVKSKDGDWSCALPALEGTQIKYWSVAEKTYKTLTLSSLTPTSTGKQNGTNNYWEYNASNGDYTLTVTCGVIHEGKGVYGMPVVVNNGGNKMYFTISSTTGYVGTGTTARAVTLTYEFKDNNGGVLNFDKTWQFNYADYKNGTQYSYDDFVKGTLKEASCVTPETLITLADGTQKQVQHLTGTEELLVWNLETGKFDSAPIMFVDSEAEAEYEVINLVFSDGTTVGVISEHGFWDYDLNKYVYLDRNAAEYIGHTFAKKQGDELVKVELVDVVLETRVTTAWSPVTVDHLCYFVDGMLSMPGGVGGLFNIFDVKADTMRYDYVAMIKDILKYGLFTYEEMNAIVPLSEEMFEAAGGPFLKVSIGKGNMTVEELITMVERYSKYI